MATRGMIGRRNPDKTITAVYSHSNNYPEANGFLLTTHYADPAKVDALIGLEAICEVGLEIGEKHDPDHALARVIPGGWLPWCYSFFRDRGETIVRAQTVTLATWPALAAEFDAEMVFLWEGDHWRCAAVKGSGEHARFGRWQPVAAVLAMRAAA